MDERQASHDADHLGERAYAEDIWLKGEQMPHKVTAISMDAPTEYQFDVPVQARQSHDPVKSLDGARKWSSKVMGVMIAGWGMRSYLLRDGLHAGANLSCTCLYLTLVAMIAAGRALGSKLCVLLDNTTADNKNNEMIFFLGWLVFIDLFEETSTFMMMKGHTYSRIDQTFRTMIVQMKSVAIWTVEMLMQYIFRFLRPYTCLSVEELHHVFDFKNFFEPHVHQRLSGFASSQHGSGMHEIRCRKDRDGNVRVWFRKSSRASTWFPEGEGYLLFGSTPVEPPPFAKGKTDSEWDREGVETTVRKWYKFMHVNNTALTKIREEWERRFDSLPPDGDTTQLDEGLKLKWVPLPLRRSYWGAEHSRTTPSFFHSDDLENPPVNPISGPGRSSHVIRRELDSYRAVMRRLASQGTNADGDPFPVFQSDYLLISKNSNVTLHRVTNGMLIDDATSKELSFTTTEYESTIREDGSKFLGVFTPKVCKSLMRHVST